MKAEKISTLQKAIATDRTNVLNLLNALHLPTVDLPSSLDNFIIAKETNTVIGTGGIEQFGQVALLRSLAVATDQQGKGLGDLLYLALMELAESKGVHQVFLITNTAADFFAKRGFTKIERTLVPEVIQNTAQFTSVCPSSAIVMYKEIH